MRNPLLLSLFVICLSTASFTVYADEGDNSSAKSDTRQTWSDIKQSSKETWSDVKSGSSKAWTNTKKIGAEAKEESKGVWNSIKGAFE